jgi:hypothetical protein
MRRGRQAKVRSGPLFPWTGAPYGYLLDAAHPRDPHRVRLDPAHAAVVEHILACRATPASRSVSLPSPHVSVRPRVPRPAVGNAGMWPRPAASCVPRSLSASRTVGGRARRAAANRRYNPLALGRVSSQPQWTSGWPCRCRPSSVKKPSKSCRCVWTAPSRWPAATTRRMSMCCVGWCAVDHGAWRVGAARCSLASSIPAVGAAPMPCGGLLASAAPRAMRRLAPSTRWSGRISAGSDASLP